MNENQKANLIAEAENIEAIRDFFTSWWTVAELYETSAKAGAAILHIMRTCNICEDDRQDLENLISQHLVMIDHLKPFAEKKDAE